MSARTFKSLYIAFRTFAYAHSRMRVCRSAAPEFLCGYCWLSFLWVKLFIRLFQCPFCGSPKTHWINIELPILLSVCTFTLFPSSFSFFFYLFCFFCFFFHFLFYFSSRKRDAGYKHDCLSLAVVIMLNFYCYLNWPFRRGKAYPFIVNFLHIELLNRTQGKREVEKWGPRYVRKISLLVILFKKFLFIQKY